MSATYLRLCYQSCILRLRSSYFGRDNGRQDSSTVGCCWRLFAPVYVTFIACIFQNIVCQVLWTPSFFCRPLEPRSLRHSQIGLLVAAAYGPLLSVSWFYFRQVKHIVVEIIIIICFIHISSNTVWSSRYVSIAVKPLYSSVVIVKGVFHRQALLLSVHILAPR